MPRRKSSRGAKGCEADWPSDKIDPGTSAAGKVHIDRS